MLDIKYIIKNKDEITAALKKRNIQASTITEIITLDEKRRASIQNLEMIKAEKNNFNKSIGKLSSEEKSNKIQEMTGLTKQEQKLEETLDINNEALLTLLKGLPNIPDKSVPMGRDDKENVVEKTVGEPTKFNFSPQDYITLAKNHDLIDTERAAKVSGTRFGYLKNEGALLWSALVQYSLDILLQEKFIPFYSPALIKEEVMINSGYDSYTNDHEAYFIEKDKLYLVGTGEHALLPYHSQETLKEDSLPLYYTTYSTCFRREAGSYGKDTKGILRVHQFDKQEMMIITKPENSWKEFDHLIEIQEKIIQGLKLPYQLVTVCTGDLPRPSAKVVDLECWIPSEQKYRETHSASNCTDYQARSNKIKFKNKTGQTEFVHILNATAITPRTLIAILENYQQPDGSIKIPKVLHPYMHKIKEIKIKK
ncbi:serine--tRNA ligase [Patescibacteria group bacterium]|nr:serine--tRNA ligase [Patescibacteria group bacterium]